LGRSHAVFEAHRREGAKRAWGTRNVLCLLVPFRGDGVQIFRGAQPQRHRWIGYVHDVCIKKGNEGPSRLPGQRLVRQGNRLNLKPSQPLTRSFPRVESHDILRTQTESPPTGPPAPSVATAKRGSCRSGSRSFQWTDEHILGTNSSEIFGHRQVLAGSGLKCDVFEERLFLTTFRTGKEEPRMTRMGRRTAAFDSCYSCYSWSMLGVGG
jgi:hypothetical protein